MHSGGFVLVFDSRHSRHSCFDSELLRLIQTCLRLAAGFLPCCFESICILFACCLIGCRHRPASVADPPASPIAYAISPIKSDSRLLAILAAVTSTLLSAGPLSRHLIPWIIPDSIPVFSAFSSALSLHLIRYAFRFGIACDALLFPRVEPPLDTSNTFGIIGCYPWLAIDL